MATALPILVASGSRVIWACCSTFRRSVARRACWWVPTGCRPNVEGASSRSSIEANRSAQWSGLDMAWRRFLSLKAIGSVWMPPYRQSSIPSGATDSPSRLGVLTSWSTRRGSWRKWGRALSSNARGDDDLVCADAGGARTTSRQNLPPDPQASGPRRALRPGLHHRDRLLLHLPSRPRAAPLPVGGCVRSSQPTFPEAHPHGPVRRTHLAVEGPAACEKARLLWEAVEGAANPGLPRMLPRVLLPDPRREREWRLSERLPCRPHDRDG